MVTARRTRLQVVPFEDRTVPAVHVDLNGAGQLTGVREISGQSEAVTLSVLPGNRITVMEGSANKGTFPVAENLRIELGTQTPFLDNRLLLNDSVLTTNLRVDLRGRATEFDVIGGTTGWATIDGNIHVTGGADSQLFLFGELGVATHYITNVTGSITVDLGPGGESPGPGFIPDAFGTVGVPPAPSSANVTGNVSVRNSTIFVWSGDIGGNLTVDSPKSINQLLFLGNFNRPMSVGGNVSIRTGAGKDLVAFQSTRVDHNATVNTGGGDDMVQFAAGENDPNDIGFNDVPAMIVGRLSVNLGDGNDVAYFGADSKTTPGQTNPLTVGGNMIVDAGAGNDQLFFPDLRVNGRLISIRASGGSDQVVLAKLIAPETRLAIDLGDGSDTVTFKDQATVSLKHGAINGGRGDDFYVPGAGNDFDSLIDRISI